MMLVPFNTDKCMAFRSKKDLRQCNYSPKKSEICCGVHKRSSNIKSKLIKNHNKEILLKIIPYFPFFKQVKCIKKVIISYFRRRRFQSINNTDFYTLESIYEIPESEYFTYVDNMTKVRYSFNVRSLFHLIKVTKSSKIINPYTNLHIDQHVKTDCLKKIKYLDNKTNENTNLIIDMLIIDSHKYRRKIYTDNMKKYIKLMHEHGYDIDENEFIKLKLYQLRTLYNELYKLWFRDMGWSNNIRQQISNDSSLFSNRPSSIYSLDYHDIRTLITSIIDRIFSSSDKNVCIMGIIMLINGLIPIMNSVKTKYNYLDVRSYSDIDSELDSEL